MISHVITGSAHLPDDTTPLAGAWIISLASGYALDAGSGFRAGVQRVMVPADGSMASVTLPETVGDDYYQAYFVSADRRIRLPASGYYTFTLTENTTWDEIIETPTIPPMTPTLVAQAETARDEAAASATEAGGYATAAEGSATAAAASAAQAKSIAGIDTTDDAMAAVFADTSSASSTQLKATIAAPVMHIIISKGQSNATGKNSSVSTSNVGLAYYDTANVDVANPRVFAWQGSGADAGRLVQAVEPLLGPAATDSVGMGPAGPLARELLADLPINDVVCIIQAGVGSTGYEADANAAGTFRWKVADVAGAVNLHANAVAMTDAAMTAARVAGYASKVFAVVEQMGEADGDGGTTGATYAADMADSIADFRARYGAGVLYLVGRMMPHRRDQTATGPDIDAACVNAPGAIELCAVRPPLDPAHNISGDGTHADAWGQRINGHQAYLSIARARANVRGVLPEPAAGLVVAVEGTVSTVTWEAPAGRVSGYSVQYQSETSPEWTDAADGLSTDVVIADAVTTVRVATINEAGASEYVEASTVPGVPVPAAPAAPVVATPSTTEMLAVAPTVAGATYTWLYRKNAEAWATATDTGASMSLTGLTADAVYTVTYSITVDGVASPFAAAVKITQADTTSATSWYERYALRKVVTTYTGPAIQVITADGSTTDIGFVGGDLDLSALAVAGAGQTLTVSKWYDQSGNARHAAQTTAAMRPTIVDSGTIVGLNGRVALRFDGVDDNLLGSFAGFLNAGAAMLATTGPIGLGAANSGYATVWSEDAGSGSGPTIGLRDHTGTTNANPVFAPVFTNNAGTALITQPPADATPHAGVAAVVTLNDDGSAITVTQNGATLSTSPLTYTRPALTTLTRTSIGCQVNGSGPRSNFVNGVITGLGVITTNADQSADIAAETTYYSLVS